MEINEEVKEKRADVFSLVSKYRVAIMGFAALWIFVFHEWQRCAAHVPVLGFWENFLRIIGFCGVDVFFLLSGLGLTYSVKKTEGGLWGFYARRLKRIALPFLIMAVVLAVHEKWDVLTFLANVTGFNFYFKDIYSLLWFIPAIATLYFIFPFYYKLLKKKPFAVFMSTLALWAVFAFSLSGVLRADLYGFINRIPVFTVGVYFGWLAQNKEIKLPPCAYIALIAVLALGLHLAYLTNFSGLWSAFPDANCFPNLLIAVSLCALLAKGMDLLIGTKIFKPLGKGVNALLAFWGAMSLEFYCVQEWLGSVLIPPLKQLIPSLLAVNIVTLAATTALAFAAHIAFKYFWKGTDAVIKRIKNKKKANS